MDTLHNTGALFTGDVIQYTQQLRVLTITKQLFVELKYIFS